MELLRAMAKFCRYSGVQKSKTTMKDLYYRHMNQKIIRKFRGLKLNKVVEAKRG